MHQANYWSVRAPAWLRGADTDAEAAHVTQQQVELWTHLGPREQNMRSMARHGSWIQPNKRPFFSCVGSHIIIIYSPFNLSLAPCFCVLLLQHFATV